MLYAVKFQRPQREIFYVLVDWRVIHQPGTVITDGNARSAATRFSPDPAAIATLNPAALSAVWWDSSDETQRKKAAEVLVPGQVDRRHLRGLVVKDEVALKKARSIMQRSVLKLPIHIKGGWYYP